MRIAFMGTPEFAVPSLEALVRSEDAVVGVVCQPDRPSGRGGRIAAPPVKRVALGHGIPVLQPETFRGGEAVAALRAWEPELVVVAAYGKILPRAVLEVPAHGCVNVHGSLLPKYRGAAPIQWAILRGEAVTGITIMQMNERMDAGEILAQRQTPIGATETFGELQVRLAMLGAEALSAALAELRRGTLRPRPQVESEATLAPRIQKADGKIDWTRAAVEIERQVRGFNPWPSAFSYLGGHLLKVHRAAVVSGGAPGPAGTILDTLDVPVVACGADALRLEEVQVEGRQRVSGAAFARGARLAIGARLE